LLSIAPRRIVHLRYYTIKFKIPFIKNRADTTQVPDMSKDIDFDEIIARYKSDPYDYIDVYAVHTGRVQFKVMQGDEVVAPSGEWKQIPGSPLYEINRERNPKMIAARTNGTISELRDELDGQFVEAGEKLLTIRHPLKKKEIIEGILREVLYLFSAPETAKYFFAMDIQSRIEKKGARSVTIEQGDEIITMSLMKRDTPVYYNGKSGVIHSVYFKPGVSVPQGEPLIGVCPTEKLPLIQKIITKVKADWDSESLS
jgi:acetyl/propionyl-CoA carboxylase alpha subunit